MRALFLLQFNPYSIPSDMSKKTEDNSLPLTLKPGPFTFETDMEVTISDEEHLLEDNTSTNPTNGDLMCFLKTMASSLNKNQEATNARFKQIEAKQEETDAKVDLMTSKFAQIEQTNAKVEETKANVAQMAEKFVKFEATMDSINLTLELNKQQKLINNLTIMNVPNGDNLDLYQLVELLAGKLGVSLNRRELINVYRVIGSRNNLVVVKLASFDKKAELLAKSKALTIKSSDILNGNHSALPLYVNNHLTPYFSRLRQAGKRAIADGKINACWMASGGMMIRTAQGAEPKLVCSIEDLNNITSKLTSKPKPTTAPIGKRLRQDDKSPKSQQQLTQPRPKRK